MVAVTDSALQLTRIVLRTLAQGRAVEIDGFGTFLPDRRYGVRFEGAIRPKVFLAYVKEDQELVELLYDQLEGEGFSPWMDLRKLVPGQNWPRAIDAAIENSDFFLACFSTRSVNKRGGFQVEIRYALDCARRLPLDEIFLVPVRLDDCRIPRPVQKDPIYRPLPRLELRSNQTRVDATRSDVQQDLRRAGILQRRCAEKPRTVLK
jgi:hypothetical protein